MKKELFSKIEIPSGVEANLQDGVLTIKGPKGELNRKFKVGKLEFKIENNKIVLGHEKATKKEKKIINTTKAHIKNMINGVQNGFEYKLKICASHFPMTVELKGNIALVKNFLGEKIAREVSVPEGVEININKETITINSPSKELAGQASANFERSTRIRNRDRRIFQDGIFITSKNGRSM